MIYQHFRKARVHRCWRTQTCSLKHGEKKANEASNRYKGVQYRWTEQPLPGRIVISLDKLYERIYRDSKSTNLPFAKRCCWQLPGRGKTEFRPDFYDADYDKFMDDFLL